MTTDDRVRELREARAAVDAAEQAALGAFLAAAWDEVHELEADLGERAFPPTFRSSSEWIHFSSGQQVGVRAAQRLQTAIADQVLADRNAQTPTSTETPAERIVSGATTYLAAAAHALEPESLVAIAAFTFAGRDYLPGDAVPIATEPRGTASRLIDRRLARATA